MELARIKKAAKADVEKIAGIGRTYGLLRRLSKINGPDASPALMDRVMYASETLPPLGKEYWWFLFFGRHGKKPVQMMLLIFRKYGKKMLFDGREMAFRGVGKNRFEAVTAGWIYDGRKLRDFGDTNAVVRIQKNKITSEISGERLLISGGFPDYRIKLGKTLDLRVTKSEYLEDRDAFGIFIPPFGMGWVDVFSDVEGTVLGKRFEGSAHLQKVFGVSIFGPFHWGRVVFRDDSVASFFCLKTGRKTRKVFCWYLVFHDQKHGEIIRFRRPKLKISKVGDGRLWVVEGKDRDKSFRIALETYAKREFKMKGGGSQVYIEYAVIPRELLLKTKSRTITLDDLGRGVGTFEDAYW